MKKLLFVSIAYILLSYSNIQAQHYNWGVGGRFGDYSGLTVKHFLSNSTAGEGLFSFGYGGFLLTGLYELQKPIVGAPNLDWYVGIGGHLGSVNGNANRWNGNYNGSYMAIGIDFIGGLEYSFREAPFSIALDWKPAINFGQDSHFWGNGLGLSLRYYF